MTYSKAIPKYISKTNVDTVIADMGGGVCNDGIVTNGCFDEDLSGWTPTQWEWQEPGRAAPTHIMSNTLMQTIDMEAGDDIFVRFQYHLEAGASLHVKLGNPASISYIAINGPADDIYTGVEVATGDTIQFTITNAATLDDWIDNVRIDKI